MISRVIVNSTRILTEERKSCSGCGDSERICVPDTLEEKIDQVLKLFKPKPANPIFITVVELRQALKNVLKTVSDAKDKRLKELEKSFTGKVVNLKEAISRHNNEVHESIGTIITSLDDHLHAKKSKKSRLIENQ
ncbi:hypothetical protein L2E82_43714 [Cichorium intybus]|uniref:Uncharacterized protein n=1 Tax=Cichorium intybus TaxID=13427 RepID=A0ACB8ZPC8_CICIN|nr:hypothetical protein L2E82_43714 [Cichorium intybus]